MPQNHHIHEQFSSLPIIGTSGSGSTAEQHLATGILFVSAISEDQVALGDILSGQQHAAGTCQQALEHLSEGGISIVLCDRNLPDGTWIDILDRVATLIDPPLLIVTCRLADEHIWAEVLNLGGYDVLIKPFKASEVGQVIKTARAYKHGQARSSHFVGGA